MKIKQIEISGLNGSEKPININFNDDINIITGRNGSGKTTILKLIWYCVSGNIERAISEIRFQRVTIKTSAYSITIEKNNQKNTETVHIIIKDDRNKVIFDEKEPISRDDAADLANHLTIKRLKTSIFFPTFRRIEGGFSMSGSGKSGMRRVMKGGEEYFIREGITGSSEIQEALEMHANRLSVGSHKFVSSISTLDIQELVAQKHNDATAQVEHFSKTLSDKIISEIKEYKKTDSNDKDALRDAVSTLDKINQDVTKFESDRENAFQALNVLSRTIVSIFNHKGITLNQRITLGDIDKSINSELLSAGEKQMLSFLCYNALYNNSPFFIDEPELSLHVDWQRILIDVLIDQKSDNQLFIATHSPFIYTQYEDKEIMIESSRGYTIE